MANNGRVAICPYYIGEQKQSITCEDTIHRYVTPDAKRNWKVEHCCSEGWGNCPYAKALNGIYAKMDGMSEEEARCCYLLHVNAAQRAEINRLLSLLGSMSTKIERLNNGNQIGGPVSGNAGKGQGEARNRRNKRKKEKE